MRAKRALIAICLLAVIGAAAYQMRRQSHRQIAVNYQVATVAKVPFGEGIGQIERLAVWEHFTSTQVGGFGKFMPGAAVDEAGNVYMTDDFHPGPMNLFVFNPHGQLKKRIKCPWIDGVAYIKHGPNQSLWLAGYTSARSREPERWDNPTQREYWRVIKAQDDGTFSWEIGQRFENRTGEWHPVQPSAKRKLNAPLPHPPDYKPTEDKFIDIDALFAADNGDAFVFASEGLLRRFNSRGKFVALYDFSSKGINDIHANINPKLTSASFSLIAARDGTVYGHFFGTRDDAGWVTTLMLNVWKTPNQRTSRMIDLSDLGHVGYGGILLRGCDAKGNLYFLYRYSTDPHSDGYSNGSDALAIARVGSDNKAVKIFDIAEHYKDILQYAELQVSTSKDKYRPAGIGDIAHVSANGDIYLEVADATHLRVDKISFQ